VEIVSVLTFLLVPNTHGPTFTARRTFWLKSFDFCIGALCMVSHLLRIEVWLKGNVLNVVSVPKMHHRTSSLTRDYSGIVLVLRVEFWLLYWCRLHMVVNSKQR
jgi:hypothetical protein